MPGNWSQYENPLLSGAFGTFQEEANTRASTADVWRQLRVNAATWQWQVQGGGPLPSTAELEETGRGLLAAQGITIQHVNAYRQLAGEWRGARESLMGRAEGEQIMGTDIWQPPWAKTAGAGVPGQYRARIKWQVNPLGGQPFEKWLAYEVTSPITTIGDILSAATSKLQGERYLYMFAGGTAPTAIEYELEQM